MIRRQRHLGTRRLRSAGPGKIDPLALAGAIGNVNSLNYDGVDEGVDMGTSAYAFERTDKFSIFGWVKFSSAGAYSMTCKSNPSSATPYRGYEIGTFAPDDVFISLISNFGGVNYISITVGTAGLFDGAWHQLGFTYAGTSLASGVKIYIDAVSQALTVATDTLSGTILDSSAKSTFGTRNFVDDFTLGNMDEHTIFDEVLTQAQVTELYNGGVPQNPDNVSDHCIGWYRMGDEGDTISTMKNHAKGNLYPGTPTNMEAGDIQADVP